MKQAVQYLEATQGKVLRVGLYTPSLTGHLADERGIKSSLIHIAVVFLTCHSYVAVTSNYFYVIHNRPTRVATGIFQKLSDNHNT